MFCLTLDISSYMISSYSAINPTNGNPRVARINVSQDRIGPSADICEDEPIIVIKRCLPLYVQGQMEM